MRRRLAELTLALYPYAFRRRYGEELRALLEQEPAGARTLLDLLRGALRAHLRPPAGLAEGLEPELRLRLSLGGVLACWVAFAAAGIAFYKTTENDRFGASPALGGAHFGVQVLAALASLAVLAGALPLVAIALRQAQREGGRLLALVCAPLVAILSFAGLTALVALLAHANPDARGTARVAFAVWVLGGAACGAVCVIAARRALLAVEVPRARLRAALGWATLVAVAMAAIAIGVAVYAVALQVRAPALAGRVNGPFGAPEAGISIALQAVWMGLFSGLALLGVRRGRRVLAAAR